MSSTNRDDKRNGALGSFLLSCVFLLFFVGLFALSQPSIRLARGPQPDFPEAFPRGVPIITGNPRFLAPDEVLPADEAEFLVPYDRDVELYVEFQSLESIKNLWSGSDAAVDFVAPYQDSFAGETRTETWADGLVVYGPDLSGFTPTMHVTLRIPAEHHHQWVDAKATLDVLYPTAAGSSSFVNTSVRLERQMRFYVVSDEEIVAAAGHDDWSGTRETLWFYYLCPGAWLGAAILFLAIGISDLRARNTVI